MKAITILERCRDAEGDMRRIRQRIQQRREASECITPKPGSSEGRGRAPAEPDKIASIVASIDELENDLAKREQARRAEVSAACALIDMLPESISTVMHKHYVKRQKTFAIAKRMGYSEGYIRKLKAKGEQLLGEISQGTIMATLPDWYAEQWPDGYKKRPRRRF